MAAETAPRDRFVNPYTFVPLPARVERREPAGHVMSPGEGRYAGSLKVEWTLRTPLLLPANAEAEGWLRVDGSVRVPGSAMKGAIRSLHETLFNGCLRVFDGDFQPVHRMAAAAGDAGSRESWRLAVVTKSKDGVPVEVEPCEKVEWIESISLKAAYHAAGGKGLPQSGDFLKINGARRHSRLRKAHEIHRVSSVSQLKRPQVQRSGDAVVVGVFKKGMRVLLVTDTAARPTKRKKKENVRPTQCYWVAGVTGGLPRIPVSEEAAANFRKVCSGSRDRSSLMQDEREGKVSDWRQRPVYEQVEWRGKQVGRRALATGYLHAGDVIWVSLSEGGDSVAEIHLSQIWRKMGEIPAKSRVPASALSCWSISSSLPDHVRSDGPEGGLCLSCEIFGSVDASGDLRDESATQRSYSGHVRVGSARSQPGVRTVPVTLASLSSPRPGAGVFYLEDHKTSRVVGDVASHWGSAVDKPERRGLRGRKFYWHVDAKEQAEYWTTELRREEDIMPRYEARTNQREGKLARDANLVPAGTVLTQKITFEGLDAVALQSLLVALDPKSVLASLRPAGVFATHLGGGKPFGLGAAIPAVTGSYWDSSLRYGDNGTEIAIGAIDPDLAALENRVGPLTHHTVLARLLDVDGLGEWRYHVAYPPGASWDQIDIPDDEGHVAFDQSYRFFGTANGERLRGVKGRPAHNRAWFPLQPILTSDGADAPPDLPIVSDSGGGSR